MSTTDQPSLTALIERQAALIDGLCIASLRLRKGYGELHPGIPAFCDSFDQLYRDMEADHSRALEMAREADQQAERIADLTSRLDATTRAAEDTIAGLKRELDAAGKREEFTDEAVALALRAGWDKYVWLSGGVPPRGTEKQLNALAVFVRAALAKGAA